MELAYLLPSTSRVFFSFENCRVFRVALLLLLEWNKQLVKRPDKSDTSTMKERGRNWKDRPRSRYRYLHGNTSVLYCEENVLRTSHINCPATTSLAICGLLIRAALQLPVSPLLIISASPFLSFRYQSIRPRPFKT